MGWWEDFVDTAVDVYEAVADTVSDVTADAAETAGNLVEDGTNAVGSTFPILAGPLSWFGGVVAGVGNFAGAIIKGVMATSCVIAGGLARIIGGLFVLNGDLMLKGLVDILSGIGGAILVVIATGWSLFQRTVFPLAKFVWSWFSPPPPWLDTSERLSITHNSCADRGAQPDIGETGQAAPHHDVPRRRIIGAREVSA